MRNLNRAGDPSVHERVEMKFDHAVRLMSRLLEGARKKSARAELGNQSVDNSEWYKSVVGGLWDEIGRLQFNFLVAQGLKPEHYLLDVGCGTFRGGVHFIRYLETGHNLAWTMTNKSSQVDVLSWARKVCSRKSQ
jgi:hypothetical protein